MLCAKLFLSDLLLHITSAMLRKRRAFSQQTALLVFEIRTWLIVSAWNACFIGDCFNIVRRRCIDTWLSDDISAEVGRLLLSVNQVASRIQRQAYCFLTFHTVPIGRGVNPAGTGGTRPLKMSNGGKVILIHHVPLKYGAYSALVSAGQ